MSSRYSNTAPSSTYSPTKENRRGGGRVSASVARRGEGDPTKEVGSGARLVVYFCGQKGVSQYPSLIYSWDILV